MESQPTPEDRSLAGRPAGSLPHLTPAFRQAPPASPLLCRSHWAPNFSVAQSDGLPVCPSLKWHFALMAFVLFTLAASTSAERRRALFSLNHSSVQFNVQHTPIKFEGQVYELLVENEEPRNNPIETEASSNPFAGRSSDRMAYRTSTKEIERK